VRGKENSLTFEEKEREKGRQNRNCGSSKGENIEEASGFLSEGHGDQNES